MCNNKQKGEETSHADNPWNKMTLFKLFVVGGSVFECIFYIVYNYMSVLINLVESFYIDFPYVMAFICGGFILMEIMWIKFLHNQCLEKRNREYIEKILNLKGCSRYGEIKVRNGLFAAEKAYHEYNYLPLIIAVGSLCVSFLNAVNGNCIMVFLAIILLLLVFGFLEKKRVYAIEDAVKEYAFKEAMKEA